MRVGPVPIAGPTFTATFEQVGSGTWTVALAEEPNVHAYGGSLVDARRNIRDAIATLFGPFPSETDGFDLVEDVRLPEAVLAMVARGKVERERAKQLREQSRAAEEAVAGAVEDALVATRQAARLVAEHGELMMAVADASALADDVRLPELVLHAVERASLARQAARHEGDRARAAQKAADVTSTEAIVTNREAARLLTEHCGLSRAEAAGLLDVSPERVRRLLTG